MSLVAPVHGFQSLDALKNSARGSVAAKYWGINYQPQLVNSSDFWLPPTGIGILTNENPWDKT